MLLVYLPTMVLDEPGQTPQVGVANGDIGTVRWRRTVLPDLSGYRNEAFPVDEAHHPRFLFD